MIKIAHLVDDCSMGGVMAALKNFDDPRLKSVTQSRTVVVNPMNANAPHVGDDVIVIHFTVSWRKLPFLMALRLRNRSARIILEEHSYTAGFETHKVGNRFRFRQMLKCSYACVDDVVAVSQGQADWLAKLVKPEKLHAIAQSRPFDVFQSVKPEDKGGSEVVTFGAIGRFHEQKGFDNLIAAFCSPALNAPRLVIAGAGEEEERLRKIASGAPNIHFMGSVSDPIEFYRKVDCVVVPSRWEAFGLVVSEAMAAGKLVLANDVDGLREQVLDDGILTRPGDVMALADMIGCIAELGRNQVIEFGEQSRLSALKRYDAMIASWKNLFCATA